MRQDGCKVIAYKCKKAKFHREELLSYQRKLCFPHLLCSLVYSKICPCERVRIVSVQRMAVQSSLYVYDHSSAWKCSRHYTCMITPAHGSAVVTIRV